MGGIGHLAATAVVAAALYAVLFGLLWAWMKGTAWVDRVVQSRREAPARASQDPDVIEFHPSFDRWVGRSRGESAS